MVHLQAVLGPVYYAVLAGKHDATLDPEPVSGYPEPISGYPEAEPKATASGPVPAQPCGQPQPPEAPSSSHGGFWTTRWWSSVSVAVTGVRDRRESGW